MADVSALKEAGIVSIRDELIRRQRAGQVVARTESGDPSFDIPPAAAVAMAKALFDGKTHYTSGSGTPELLEAVVHKLKEENGIGGIGTGDVIVTNGAMHALYVVFRALVRHPGDEILVPTPTWTETATNVELAGGKPVYYRIDPFAEEPVDMDALRSLIGPRTKAVVVNTPHNPTGRIIPRGTLGLLRATCLAAKIPLVTDEAYEHLTYDGAEHVSPASIGSQMSIYDIAIFSCSKSYAMSGLRVGYVACPNRPLMRQLRFLVRCSANGINSVAQHGAAAVLREPDIAHRVLMLSAYATRRKVLHGALKASPHFDPVEPEGAFYVWARIADESVGSWDMTAKLLELGVGSAPGEVFGPGGKGHIRFAFSCPTDHVIMAADRIGELEL